VCFNKNAADELDKYPKFWLFPAVQLLLRAHLQLRKLLYIPVTTFCLLPQMPQSLPEPLSASPSAVCNTFAPRLLSAKKPQVALALRGQQQTSKLN
jgi:hypothetical protein